MLEYVLYLYDESCFYEIIYVFNSILANFILYIIQFFFSPNK